MILLGIDPGFSGALCAYVNGEYIFHDMPLCSTKTGKNVTNIAELARIIKEINPTNVVIEKVGASLAHGSKPFHAEFGSDAELLTLQNEMLHGE